MRSHKPTRPPLLREATPPDRRSSHQPGSRTANSARARPSSRSPGRPLPVPGLASLRPLVDSFCQVRGRVIVDRQDAVAVRIAAEFAAKLDLVAGLFHQLLKTAGRFDVKDAFAGE